MATDCNDLLDKAKRKRASVTFAELRVLAECYGFTFNRQSGSHHIYVRSGAGLQDFQPRKRDAKMAKPYQVKQLLDFIDTLSEK
jgi:hypothetical protein